MKRLIVIVIFSFCGSMPLYAQDTTHKKTKYTSGQDVAQEIANKMQVLLQLDKQQQNKIYNINLKLNDEKSKAFKKYANRNAVGNELQRIENTRDTIYSEVLTPGQFQIYKQRKKYLVSSSK